MRPELKPSRHLAHVSIVGAGIAGTWQALLFAKAGHPVTVYERSGFDLAQSTSVRAGGMLAPWCEQEASEPVITRLGARALALWREHVPEAQFNGSLVSRMSATVPISNALPD